MIIKTINIKNYRSCADVELSPNKELSVLIGPNGSGKTTVLSAIRLLISLFKFDDMNFDNDSSIDDSTACTIKVVYDDDGKKIIHTAIMNIMTNEKNEDVIIQAKESWYLFDINGSKKKLKYPNYFIQHIYKHLMRSEDSRVKIVSQLKNKGLTQEAFEAIDKIANFIKSISYYSASQFTDPSICPISFEVEKNPSKFKKRSEENNSTHKKWLLDMYYESKKNNDVFNDFISLIGSDGINLIDKITFKEYETSSPMYSVSTGGKFKRTEKTNILVIPSFSINGYNFSPNQLSEGTFKTLALIFYILSDKSKVLLIEEPEVCVHHGLLKSIITLIKSLSKDKQIIFSTHSDTILDSLEISSIFSVSKNKERGTLIRKLSQSMDKDELLALKNYLENEGSLGEYWKHGDLENV